MKLPIPILVGDQSYHEINLKKPKQGVIIDAKKIAESDIHRAIYIFIVGCTVSISSPDETIEDAPRIKAMLTELPWKSAEMAAIECAKIYHDGDDAVEGDYKCPHCKHVNPAKLDEENDIDTRDFLKDLVINMLDSDGKEGENNRDLLFEFNPPVQIKDGDDGFTEITSVGMIYPLIKTMFSAVAKVGQGNEVDLQTEILIQSIVKANGKEINGKFRNRWGDILIRNIEEPADMNNIIDTLDWPGLDPTVKKRCVKCSANFDTTIEAGNFFVSALGSKGRKRPESQKKPG